jgi:hypothetical protein
MHWCTTLTDRHFFQKMIFANCLMMDLFAHHRYSTYNQCQQSIFALRTGFFASLVITTEKVLQ